MGLNLSSTLELYQLGQQVACQRYRQPIIDARKSIQDQLVATFGNFQMPATAGAAA